MGLTFQQIQKYQNGFNWMSSRLHQIADILKVPIPDFFEGAPGSKAPRSPDTDFLEEFTGSADGRRLIKAYQNIADREIRRHITKLVGRLAQ